MEERNLETTKPLVESNDVNDKASTKEKQLPATGETSNPLLFLSGLSLVLTATFLLKSKKDESN